MKAAAITIAILATIAVVFLAINGLENRGPGTTPELSEIMALSSAIESYKTDNGHYPTDPASTGLLKPNAPLIPAAYERASAFLYRALWGMDETDPAKRARYASDFPARWLRADKNGIVHIVDPHGNYVGYSAFKAVHPESPDGYNPTFDLWSTAGNNKQIDQMKWAKNW